MFDNFMSCALEEAKLAARFHEVPVGAVIVDLSTRKIIARGKNSMICDIDPTAHAEMNVIRFAAKQKDAIRLQDCIIYTTLEPCPMCAFAISLARIRAIYIGAKDFKAGAFSKAKLHQAGSLNHIPELYWEIMSDECGLLLSNFFAQKR